MRMELERSICKIDAQSTIGPFGNGASYLWRQGGRATHRSGQDVRGQRLRQPSQFEF